MTNSSHWYGTCDVSVATSSDVEVKRAHDRLPKSTHETLSAFANKEGGVLILGLDEKSGFESVGVRDAAKLVADLGPQCSEFEPPIRADIKTRRFESVDLIVAEIPETLPAQKPCHLKSMGIYQGSFIRVGDGDRRMTQYEILAALDEGALSRSEIQTRTGLPRQTVLRWLDRLKRAGLVESLGRNRNEIRYQRTGQQRLTEADDVNG
ncbi:RNA-binding domain-containing protein [Nocardiopsis sp. CNT312]|uniref:RNA-binding domain-containing protein n=1 Tax=Nocardiopsis sp. CNT312 TaxID=1137268 RepID=UPI00048A898E|nr:RNA-binding domain-containing protein [Nocardiopsis sp. CNT312]